MLLCKENFTLSSPGTKEMILCPFDIWCPKLFEASHINTVHKISWFLCWFSVLVYFLAEKASAHKFTMIVLFSTFPNLLIFCLMKCWEKPCAWSLTASLEILYSLSLFFIYLLDVNKKPCVGNGSKLGSRMNWWGKDPLDNLYQIGTRARRFHHIRPLRFLQQRKLPPNKAFYSSCNDLPWLKQCWSLNIGANAVVK